MCTSRSLVRMPSRRTAAVSLSNSQQGPQPSWSDLPASLLERLFVEATGIRSSAQPHTGDKFCSSQVGCTSPGVCPSTCQQQPHECLNCFHSKPQEVMSLTAVCRNWRQACQMSVFQPGRPWTLPSDYVLPLQLFAKVL